MSDDWELKSKAPPSSPPAPESDAGSSTGVGRSPAVRREDSPGIWRAVAFNGGIGIAIAILAALFPFTNFVLHIFEIIIHEFGHAATAWGFGYPSIPALDLSDGGGLTTHQERSVLVIVLIYAALASLVISVWHDRRSRYMVLLLVAIHIVLSLLPVHRMLIVAMGHGMELAIGGLFIYRGISGHGSETGFERPLYVAIGCFMPVVLIRLSYNLMTDLVYRAGYLDFKDGSIRDDLTVLADDFFHVRFAVIAGGMFVAAILAMLCGFALAIWQLRAEAAAVEDDDHDALV